MMVDEDGIRGLVSAALVAFMIVVAGYLWFINLIVRQTEFGLFLASELLALAMLLYVLTKTDYSQVKGTWLLAGCFCAILFLAAALAT